MKGKNELEKSLCKWSKKVHQDLKQCIDNYQKNKKGGDLLNCNFKVIGEIHTCTPKYIGLAKNLCNSAKQVYLDLNHQE